MRTLVAADLELNAAVLLGATSDRADVHGGSDVERRKLTNVNIVCVNEGAGNRRGTSVGGAADQDVGHRNGRSVAVLAHRDSQEVILVGSAGGRGWQGV